MPAQAGIHGGVGAFLSPTLNSYYQKGRFALACHFRPPPTKPPRLLDDEFGLPVLLD